VIEDEVGRLLNSTGFTSTASHGVTLRSLVYKIEAPWEFDETVDPVERIESIERSLLGSGIPFLEAHLSYDALLRAYGNGKPDNFGTQYRYPVVLKLLGRKEEAIAYLDHYIGSFPKEYEADSYFPKYLAFAERFRSTVASKA